MPIMNTTFCFGSMAKLNLGLSILGKLASGDYRLDTVMTRIPLYDEVCLDWQKQNKEIKITCDNQSVPLTGANSLYQAYQVLILAESLEFISISSAFISVFIFSELF